jgi:hypothetical protein
MHTEVSSENDRLIKPVTDLDIQPSQNRNMSSGTLDATSPEGDVTDESTIPMGTQIPASAPSIVDSKSRPRRHASPRCTNGSGPSSEVTAVNRVTNSDEAPAEHRKSESSYFGSEYADKEEVALVKEIAQIWGSVQLRTSVIRKNSAERAAFKVNLARELYGFKARLVGSGRLGKWSAFLRDIDMPRATADRYVQRCEHLLAQVGENRPSEPVSAPTAEEVNRMVNKIKPRLLRVLTTTDAVEQFMAALEAALQVPRSN